MTQRSRPQADNNATAAYTDSGPYSGDQWRERIYAAHTGDENTASQRARLRGVVPTFDNQLVVGVAGGPGIPVNVGTGAGIVYGSYLFNSALVSFDPPAPVGNPRIDLVCMVENNTNAAVDDGTEAAGWVFPTALADYDATPGIPPYSARLVIVKGTVGAGEPDLDVSNTLFMVPIAEYEISVLGAITNYVDRREFVDIEQIVSVATGDDDTIEDALIIGTQVTNGAGDDGLGVAIRAKLENSTGDLEDAGQLAIRWTDATNASEDSRLELRLSSTNALNLSAVINAPTAASADGNARGVGAVDLQQTRAAVAQVASGTNSGLFGGNANRATNTNSVCVGGSTNVASGQNAGLFCGNTNQATATNSACFGGDINTASNTNSIVVGANGATASGTYSVVLGGTSGIASGDRSIVLGGSANTADGSHSLAAGKQADANSFDGVFIWADSEAAAFTADNANQFKVRASGGTSLVQNNNAAALTVLKLTQTDQDETCIDFVGTSAADQTKSISTVNGDGAVTGPKNFSAAPGWEYVGMVKIDVNGAPFWIPYYQPDTA